MKKYLLVLSVMIFTLISCDKEAKTADVKDDASKTVTLQVLNSGNYEYKTGDVEVEGLCVHVCTHSGKKMFIVGDNPDDKLQIFTGDNMSVFPKDLEGSKLKVVGFLEEERIDMKYVQEWEAELAAEAKDHEGHSCSFEEDMNKVKNIRSMVESSPKGYISKYTMTAKEFKKI